MNLTKMFWVHLVVKKTIQNMNAVPRMTYWVNDVRGANDVMLAFYYWVQMSLENVAFCLIHSKMHLITLNATLSSIKLLLQEPKSIFDLSMLY